ncbi:ABC transporter ATP-binding protein [Streptococcus agalactiae]|nr:ABC transporter ATP-binding protein [Streptococcus agalactiae]
MKNYLKNKFQLTESGAKGLIKSIISFYFYYFSFIPPMICVFMFADKILMGKEMNVWGFVVFLLISAICMYFITNVNYKTTYNETYKESANLRVDIATILSKLPLSYFSKHDVSDLAQTIMSDIAAIEHALAHAIGNLIGFILYFITVGIMMLIGDFRLGMSVIIPILCSCLVILITKKYQIKVRTEHYHKLRDISESFQSTIEMNQEIKSYGLKNKAKTEINNKLIESEKMQWKSEIAQAVPISIAQYIAILPIGITLAVGLHLLASNQTTIMYLIGYTVAAAKMSGGMTGVFLYLAEIFYLDSRINRIGEIRNTSIQEGKNIDLHSFDIELENVEFSYNQDSKVINKVSFVAKQNEVTALVGPSGCGKTTLLRLISRLYDYDKGSIKIGGYDIKEIDTECLFKYISIVFQDVILFNTSVMENIRIGNIKATDEQVVKAAKQAGCEHFINRLPNGFDTMIGENGSKLSGGERQRLSIARAILKDAPIVILDEISASLDVENEIRIQKSLNNLIKNKTVIIISHRMKSIENADKIIVMNDKKVENMGTHEYLMKNSPVYNNLIDKSEIAENYVY